MGATSLTFGDRLASFQQEVQQFHDIQLGRHRCNFRLHWLLVISVLACSVATTVGGVLKWPYVVIALTGLAGSTLIALHTAIAIGDRAEFQRVIASEAANLLSDAKQSTLTEESFEQIRTHFKELRKHADAQLPRGAGMDAVRSLPRLPKV